MSEYKYPDDEYSDRPWVADTKSATAEKFEKAAAEERKKEAKRRNIKWWIIVLTIVALLIVIGIAADIAFIRHIAK